MDGKMPSESSSRSKRNGDRFRRTVCRVLIALSFKSFTKHSEPNRKRERSDCSEARFLPAPDEPGIQDQDEAMENPQTVPCNMAAMKMTTAGEGGGGRRRGGGGGGGGIDASTTDEENRSQVYAGLAAEMADMPRLGRRQAIFDPKALGLVSAPDGTDSSPTNSLEEAEFSTLMVTERHLRRKRSSADLGVNYPGDLLSQVRPKRPAVPPLLKRNTIADFANTKAAYQSTSSLAQTGEAVSDKKLKRTFSLLKLKKSHRSKDNLLDLSEVLQNLKPSTFKDNNLISYKDSHWSDLIGCRRSDDDNKIAADNNDANDDDDADVIVVETPEIERKRREAVWELFRSECVFLIDHLMVLKHCFMEPMKKVQVEGHLMFTEPQELFGNLDELCYVSYTFSRDFVNLLLKDQIAKDFGRTEVLIKGLKRFCQLTRDGEVYHDYCLNYAKAMTYLEQLRKNEEFCEFEKWCCQDERCHRLQLNDLLISPMQHCTKVPLLLNNIRKYTEEAIEQSTLTESLQKLETSLQNLEAKMRWLKNYERVQEIQQQVVWRPITELEPRAFIPEFLRASLSRQPCERLLTTSNRHLLHEGSVTLLEISKCIDMYMFLFDDIILLTRIKKAPRKKSNPNPTDTSPFMQPKVQTDGAVFVVHRQPIALDRVTVHDVRPDTAGVLMDYVECSSEVVQLSPDSDGNSDWCLPHFVDDVCPQRSNLLFGCVSSANGLKNAFVLVQFNQFQQIIAVYTLEAPTENTKSLWLSRLHEAQEKYKEACKKLYSNSQPEHPGVVAPILEVLQEKLANPKSTVSPSTQKMLSAGNDKDNKLDEQHTRRIRSSSSDAAATLDNSETPPRRISDPVYHTSDREFVEVLSVTQPIAKPTEKTEIQVIVEPMMKSEFTSTLKTASMEQLPPALPQESPPVVQHGIFLIEQLDYTSPALQRQCQTSLRDKRRTVLKSIHEKSQSIDTW